MRSHKLNNLSTFTYLSTREAIWSICSSIERLAVSVKPEWREGNLKSSIIGKYPRHSTPASTQASRNKFK